MPGGLPRRRLLFGAGFVDLIRSGRKQVTFRSGRRKFKPGELVLGQCAEGATFLLRVTGTQFKVLRDVTPEEAVADLFESQEAVLKGMQIYYPEMTWNSEITIVRFELVGERLFSRDGDPQRV